MKCSPQMQHDWESEWILEKQKIEVDKKKEQQRIEREAQHTQTQQSENHQQPSADSIYPTNENFHDVEDPAFCPVFEDYQTSSLPSPPHTARPKTTQSTHSKRRQTARPQTTHSNYPNRKQSPRKQSPRPLNNNNRSIKLNFCNNISRHRHTFARRGSGPANNSNNFAQHPRPNVLQSVLNVNQLKKTHVNKNARARQTGHRRARTPHLLQNDLNSWRREVPASARNRLEELVAPRAPHIQMCMLSSTQSHLGPACRAKTGAHYYL